MKRKQSKFHRLSHTVLLQNKYPISNDADLVTSVKMPQYIKKSEAINLSAIDEVICGTKMNKAFTKAFTT